MKQISIFFIGAALIISSCSDTSRQKTNDKNQSFSLENKRVTVYTTADQTDLRLTQNEILDFEDLNQPFETEPCVFIDPTQTFQTMVGIGAALTDASAETFAKLPVNKQEEFLTAYFDKEKGIGYTLSRTNINSCDSSSGSYTY